MATVNYQCLDCNHAFPVENSMSHWWVCEKCGSKNCFDGGVVLDDAKKRRVPLTDWQKKKLEFYRSDKKWQEDIMSRKILPNGDVAIMSHTGKIKEVRKRNGDIIQKNKK